MAIIGFPQKQVGRRDFPDMEQATIASGWHQSINGDRCFIVDKALSPGFSVSPVILERRSINSLADRQGHEILFPGIYSGIRNDSKWIKK